MSNPYLLKQQSSPVDDFYESYDRGQKRVTDEEDRQLNREYKQATMESMRGKQKGQAIDDQKQLAELGDEVRENFIGPMLKRHQAQGLSPEQSNGKINDLLQKTFPALYNALPKGYIWSQDSKGDISGSWDIIIDNEAGINDLNLPKNQKEGFLEAWKRDEKITVKTTVDKDGRLTYDLVRKQVAGKMTEGQRIGKAIQLVESFQADSLTGALKTVDQVAGGGYPVDKDDKGTEKKVSLKDKVGDWFRPNKKNIRSFDTEADAEEAIINGDLKPGDQITIGGRKVTVD